MSFTYKNMLGRTETQNRDRMYCHTIRTVRYISRDDRARIATCNLRTQTDIRKENYSIDETFVAYIIAMCVYHLFVRNNVGTLEYRSINKNKNKLSD